MGLKITKKGCELDSESQKVFLPTTSIIAARITFWPIDKILNAANFSDRMTCKNQADILQKNEKQPLLTREMNYRLIKATLCCNLYFRIGSFLGFS